MVPAWNAERFLGATLASLVAQDYPNLEILVADDASTDGTPRICEEFAAAHPAVRVTRNVEREGFVGNANVLLRRAKGDYAFFAPHDDLFDPTYVSRLVAELEARPETTLAFSHTRLFDDTGDRGVRIGEVWARTGGRLRRGLRWVLRPRHPERGAAFRGLLRVDAAREIAGLRRSPAVEFSADSRWLFRLNLLGPFVLVPEVLCHKRLHLEGAPHATMASRRGWRERVGEARLCAAEIRDARLPVWPRVALLAAVPARLAASIIGSRLARSRRRRAARRRAVAASGDGQVDGRRHSRPDRQGGGRHRRQQRARVRDGVGARPQGRRGGAGVPGRGPRGGGR
jgi:glycosyltransferase involved in cell wall biosynthesis